MQKRIVTYSSKKRKKKKARYKEKRKQMQNINKMEGKKNDKRKK